MFDLTCSLIVLAVSLVAGIAWIARRASVPPYARVHRDGGSALLSAHAMNAGYWALQPLGALLSSAGVTPDAITLASLVVGLGAGVALGSQHFGLGALLASVGFLGDALDGLVARTTGVASDAGEVFDAAADRWGEAAFLSGVAFAFRAHPVGLLLALFALSGAFMVSYATAKSEAMRVDAPRGGMRRVERAVYLTVAAVLTPLFVTLSQRHAWPFAVEYSPMLAALALVGSVGNLSAVLRFRAVAASLRKQTGSPLVGSATARQTARQGIALLLRHQAGSIASTVVDFATMITAVEALGASPAGATALGATVGAVTNFTLGRRWIFRRAVAGQLGPQAVRYVLVSATSLGLNTIGEYVLSQRLGVSYVLARLCVALAVSLLWNFPMQRWFVFGAPAESHG